MEPTGINTVPVKVDAADRAKRTFWQLFAIDVAVILIPLLVDVLANTNSWESSSYWVTVGVSVGKTVLGVILSYVIRLKSAPVGAVEPADGGPVGR